MKHHHNIVISMKLLTEPYKIFEVAINYLVVYLLYLEETFVRHYLSLKRVQRKKLLMHLWESLIFGDNLQFSLLPLTCDLVKINLNVSLQSGNSKLVREIIPMIMPISHFLTISNVQRIL